MNGLGSVKVFTTNAGRPLAEKICGFLSIELGEVRVARFNDGEVDVQLKEDVRGHDVFIIAPTHTPAENLIEAIHLAEAARFSSAGRVTYVIPYFGSGRSDRKDAPRKPIGAVLAIRMLECAQPDRFIFLDMHAEQTIGSILKAIPDHLYGSAVAEGVLGSIVKGRDFVIASPDKGGVPRAEKYAGLLGQDDVVVFSKSRSKPGEVKKSSVKIIGDVENKDVIFVDDIIDTAGTIVADAAAAREAGATDIYVFATHAVLSKDALKIMNESPISRIYVTDSIHHDLEMLKRKCPKLTVISVAPLLARAIRRTHDGESLSILIR
jgi:ribose-phosphate pyrophosphokinase